MLLVISIGQMNNVKNITLLNIRPAMAGSGGSH